MYLLLHDNQYKHLQQLQKQLNDVLKYNHKCSLRNYVYIIIVFREFSKFLHVLVYWKKS